MGMHHLPRNPGLRLPVWGAGSGRRHRQQQSKTAGGYAAADFPFPAGGFLALGLRTLLLAFRPANLPFVLFVGSVYWFLAWELRRFGVQRVGACPSES